jgi:glutamyl-tRNA reductase
MTKSVYFMEKLSELRACGWNTVALRRDELRRVQERMREAHAGEALVVSCQRVEAYGFGACGCEARLGWHGRAALDHLAEVAAGLHSAVLGEGQILGQVRDGFADASGGELGRAGALAVAAARELRRKTAFNSHAGHLLDRALKLAGMAPSGRILVLGNGQMGRLVAERAVEIGFVDVIVAGRAARPAMPGRPVTLGHVRGLEGVDVIVGCLGSGAAEMEVESLPTARLVVDLGTPRNFGPHPRPLSRLRGRGRTLDGASDDATQASGHGGARLQRLITIADLMADESRRPHAKRRRAALRRELSAIVDARLAAEAEDARSLVGSLRARLEAMRKREAARMQRLHPDVPPEAIEAMTRSLVNRLMHAPTERLRRADPALGREVVALFE